MSISENPAFPCEGGQNNGHQPYSGLTTREYFAAMAMQACRSRPSEYGSWDELALDAVEIANALIKALEGKD